VLVFALESSTPNGHFLVHYFVDYNQRNLFVIFLQFWWDSADEDTLQTLENKKSSLKETVFINTQL